MSSIIDRNKYSSSTCGIKLKTESKPASNPSHRKPLTHVPSYPARASPAADASIRLPVHQPKRLCSHTPRAGTPTSPGSIMSADANVSFVTLTPNSEFKNSTSSLNVTWNTANMISTKIGNAQTRCVSTLSALSERESRAACVARFKHGE